MPVPSVGVPAAGGEQEVAPISWGACPPGSLDKVPELLRPLFSCATYPVPMDYADPSRGTVPLALMRRTTVHPEQRIGSLFVYPGGPLPGFAVPVGAERGLQQPVLDRFDVIGFDPRGVGRSAPVKCFTSAEEAKPVRDAMMPAPLSPQDINTTMAAWRQYGQACARNIGPLLEHMSTADIARDLDRLRAAVGDEKLTYLGFSYGTLMGATYANLFPQRVRALVLDSNIDPALWAGDGFEYDRQTAQGYELALHAFLTQCQAAGDRCAFGSGDPVAKFEETRDRLRQGPLKLADGSTVTFDTFVSQVKLQLFEAALQPLAEGLQVLYGTVHPGSAAPSPAAQSRLQAFTRPAQPPLTGMHTAATTPYTNLNDAPFTVNCTDRPFPRTPAVVPQLAEKWEQGTPTFGRTEAFFVPAGCTNWPTYPSDAYRGPWNHPTAAPVLVFGNLYDPITPYEFSRRMARELGNATLVTVDAFGHTILSGRSGCADTLVTHYLDDLETPPPGQTCQTNTPPF